MKIAKVFYSRGKVLSAIVAMPDDSETIRPAVVLCHGHSRHKNDGLDRLSDLLVEAGFLTLRMDFRGCGSSAAERYQLYCGDEWCEDLMNAISFLKTIPMVDPDRIGVVGISMGASTVVNTTGMDHRIRSTVAMAGIGDCERWLRWVWQENGGDFDAFRKQMEDDSVIAAATGHSQVIPVLNMYHKPEADQRALRVECFWNSDVNGYVSLGALRSLLRYKPLEKCPYIKTPIFFAHGGSDDIVPFQESEDMYNAVASQTKQLKKYPGMEHNLPMDPARDTVFFDIVDWFRHTL